jgi:hypothetical protein
MADTPATTSRTRRQSAATDRSAAAKKAAATRARNRAAEASTRSAAATKAAETRREAARGPVERYAGKAVTIPVGAALVARDNVAATVGELTGGVERELRARRRRVEAELRRFERRGESARDRVERELRESRSRVRRDLRAVSGTVVATRRDLETQAGLVGARVENFVQRGITGGTQVAARVTERVARVA